MKDNTKKQDTFWRQNKLSSCMSTNVCIIHSMAHKQTTKQQTKRKKQKAKSKKLVNTRSCLTKTKKQKFKNHANIKTKDRNNKKNNN